MSQTMTKTRAMPGMSASATTATFGIVLIMLSVAGVSAQVSPAAGPTLFEVKWTPDSNGSATDRSSQTPATTSADDLKVTVYPLLVWVPSFGAEAAVPPFPDIPGGPELPGGSGSTSSHIDGAALVGLSLEKARWRVDAEGIWGALTTQRDTPLLKVDLDVIYGHVSVGVKVYKDLYATAGVRRLALTYDITLGERPSFRRKPGLWDPLIGLGWHAALGRRWELHVSGEGGGFGVGADVDLSAAARADWRIAHHVGVTFGYNVLYLKVSDTVGPHTLTVKQTLTWAGVGDRTVFLKPSHGSRFQ